MKVLISGKGGSGKSTLAALLSRALQARGNRVLLVDADESNLGVQRLVGIDNQAPLMDRLGGKQAFKQTMSQVFPQGPQHPVFKAKTIDQLPDDCVTAIDGIRLLVIGKIQRFGEGCACSMGALSKTVLGNLRLNAGEVVIVDTEAGVEHFGRRVDGECDAVVGVVDPTYESFQLAGQMQAMALQAGVAIGFVLNKTTPQIEAEMRRHLAAEKIVASIAHQDALFLDSLQGRPLSITVPAVDQICQWLEALA
jgi:CO dehydrogenase maturation factor